MMQDGFSSYLAKQIFSALVVPLIVGAGGAWMGVEVTIARLEERIAADERRVEALHERLTRLEMLNTDYSSGPLSEFKDLRERITRVEEQMRVLHQRR